MSVSSISELSRQHMLNILGYGSGSGQVTGTNTSGGSSASGAESTFAQILSELQQLDQNNPKQYSQVTQQISTNLSGAAANAQAQGKSGLATQLSTLSQDFSTASQTGQMPSIGDLAKAMIGGRHHHGAGASGDSDAATAAATAGTGTAAAPSAHSGLLNFVQQALNLAGI